MLVFLCRRGRRAVRNIRCPIRPRGFVSLRLALRDIDALCIIFDKSAIGKNTIAKRRRCFTFYDNLVQIIAVYKCLFPNARYTVRYRYFFKSTAPKCKLPDTRYTA